MRQQIHRILSRRIKTPKENENPLKDWFIPDMNKKIVRVEVRKYPDGEVAIDIVLEDSTQ